MSTDNKTTTERLSDVAVRANALCQTVAEQSNNINASLQQAKAEFDDWKSDYTELVNGLQVHKQGNVKRFYFSTMLGNGGYTAAADGPDAEFPYCAAPLDPYYINLLEFDAQNGGGFGATGDYFKCEIMITHRGMFASYNEHLIITGTSFQDCVSGIMEVKNVSRDGHLSVFISEPDNPEREIPLDKALTGTSIPVFFRKIGQGADSGIARLTLKVDPRFHCGAARSISVSSEYTSFRGRPCVERITHNKPSWEV
ncbi:MULTISPECIES: hypothetical protein [unclassified Pseudoalteromonas]|uniref:hypothetical protein n=1 Tax=unclassified Pseudoalteromonas TaxID=194690 RepID=UPI0020968AD5|nr:hypothetical protein [Pseudoalteromonas sp. XMcav2-N]MCO7190235.1 hypothetical protein [Pseudoalteromonas sp. XMcav2-N]